MSDWWRAVDDELRRLGDAAPDPWAGVESPPVDVGLTAEQLAFLAQLAGISGFNLDHDDQLDDELQFDPDPDDPLHPVDLE